MCRNQLLLGTRFVELLSFVSDLRATWLVVAHGGARRRAFGPSRSGD